MFREVDLEIFVKAKRLYLYAMGFVQMEVKIDEHQRMSSGTQLESKIEDVHWTQFMRLDSKSHSP